jgi:hypothetical protein
MFHIMCLLQLTQPGDYYPSLPSTRPVILHKKMTWSLLHTYHERYPDDLKRPDGDIAVRSLNNRAGANTTFDTLVFHFWRRLNMPGDAR